tara:strand:+ start:175 stop:363 length:189 start_codon:yes stop_codon:yes gene_type:complete
MAAYLWLTDNKHIETTTHKRERHMLTETLLNSRELIALTGASIALVLPPVLFIMYALIKGIK